MKWRYISALLPALLLMGPGAARAQEINGDFEEWKVIPGGYEIPSGWSAMPHGCGKGERARSGNFAASVWNWYIHVKGSMMLGDLPEGVLDWPLESGGVPIGFKPAQITGYYRYQVGDLVDGATDSGSVIVLLKKFNAARGGADTIGLATHYFRAAEEYTPFTVDITDMAPGISPDSIAMVFISSQGARCAESSCCYLSIDDLRVSAPSGVSYSVDDLLRKSKVVPNPVRGIARIEWGRTLERPHRLRVYSASGGLVRELPGVSGTGIALDATALPAGAYLFDLSGDDGMIAARGRFMVR